MTHPLLRAAAMIAMIAVVALLVGFGLGAATGWAVLALAAIALLAYHLVKLAALTRWLRRPRADALPEARGAWDEVFALLYRFERSAAREADRLARALVRWRQAGEALPDGVVILDAQNRIEWCNEGAARHFGLDPGSDVGRPVINLVRHPEFVAYVEAEDYVHAIPLRSEHGGGLYLSVQVIPYGEAQKLLLSRDITRFEKVETMRRDFVANVSHELRTPLTVLAGFLETVQELELDPRRTRDYVDLMAEQARRMQRIVDDLLALSALEYSPEPSLEERVNVRGLLARVKADAEALSGGRHQVTLDAMEGIDIAGAESEIASAFGNLASNAVRYTPEGGSVRLSWRGSSAGAEFVVEDTGIGIEPQHIARLTERFYRVDRGRSRETGGTGLGLAIVKHALMRHQATLDIQSEPGRGSRFSARFPARRIVPAAIRSAGAPV
ncbi:MAG: phosphate regulon sensor histidine kinase PhoR [Burkholderiales bacterium]